MHNDKKDMKQKNFNEFVYVIHNNRIHVGRIIGKLWTEELKGDGYVSKDMLYKIKVLSDESHTVIDRTEYNVFTQEELISSIPHITTFEK